MIHNGNTKLVNLRESSVSFLFFVLPFNKDLRFTDHSSGALPQAVGPSPGGSRKSSLDDFALRFEYTVHIPYDCNDIAIQTARNKKSRLSTLLRQELGRMDNVIY